MANQVDQPVAGLIADLKQRGLFDSTLIVFATEFGRTPGLDGAAFGTNDREGRDHHPFGFSVWMAGGGIKGASPMAQPMNSVFTPSSTGTMSRIFTQRFCINSVSLRRGSTCRAESGSRKTTESPSKRF